VSLDLRQIDIIKGHFARKSSAHLRQILQIKDQERWSPEAFAAASEVLTDRGAGRAQEPLVPAKDTEPPSSGHTVDSVALIAGINVLTFPLGFLVLPTNAAPDTDTVADDLPLPFGSDLAWLALSTKDTMLAASYLGLQEAREATWEEGIEAAYKSSLFVAPPVADWTLAVSTALFPPERIETFVKPLLERLSRQFGDAQYFCSRPEIEMYAWARAQKGRLVRGFSWLGEKNLTTWNGGVPTPEERHLGFQFVGGQHGNIEPDDHTADPIAAPNEDCVTQLAFLWSIDPTTLNEQYKEPALGILGEIPRSASE
jgi:hypothetical protein